MRNTTHSHRKHGHSHNGPRAAAQAESTVGHLLSSAGQMMEDGYGRASEMAHTTYEHGRDMATDLTESASELVQARPMESVLVAAGVGLLVGFVLGRRH